MKTYVRILVLAGIAAGLRLASAGSAEPKLCDGHDVNVKWSIQTGDAPIFVRVHFTAGRTRRIYADDSPTDWGHVGPGTRITMRVRAADFDEHVCNIPQTAVKNHIKPTKLRVVIRKNSTTGPVVKTVFLTTDEELITTDRTWTGTWPMGSENAGQILVFCFEGEVDDETCTQHKASNDDPVKLNQAGAFYAVKIGGRASALTPPTGRFRIRDGNIYVKKGKYRSNPLGAATIEAFRLRDRDRSADGRVVDDTFNGTQAIKWSGSNSIFDPAVSNQKRTQWSGPGLGAEDADIALSLNDDGNPANDGGYIAVASIRVIIDRIYLKDVSFSGAKYHVVAKDDGSGNYAVPHWQDNSSPLDGNANDGCDRKHPACFTRGSKMRLSCKLVLDPEGEFNNQLKIKIKGDGPDNLDVPAAATARAGNEVTITNRECSNPFANGDGIRFFDSMTITWQVSLDDGTTWTTVGASDNQVYVTLGDPITTVYHTLVHLGCKNAKGETAAAQATVKIWSEFTDRIVKRVDKTPLGYYKSYKSNNKTTAALLKNGDGQCGSWARFLIDMLKVQRIDNANDFVTIRPKAATGARGFMVKTWAFTGAGTSGDAAFPYLNVPETTMGRTWSAALLLGDTSYNWVYAEVTDAPEGVGKGQSNSNPASLFYFHQLVKIGGTYYDPSYGKSFSSVAAIDNQAIAGYWKVSRLILNEPAVNADLNHDTDKVDNGVDTDTFVLKKNPVGNDLDEFAVNY